MNELKTFDNPEFGEIRVIEIDGDPWFVAADVCRALDISNPTDAIKRLDDDERARFNLGHPMNDTNCVNEPGLYALILGSRKPEAKAFKRWITHEVIPSIKNVRGKTYSECNRDIQKWFLVNSRNNIPRKRFDEAVEYVQRWRPSTNVSMLIQQSNHQTNMYK